MAHRGLAQVPVVMATDGLSPLSPDPRTCNEASGIRDGRGGRDPGREEKKNTLYRKLLSKTGRRRSKLIGSGKDYESYVTDDESTYVQYLN